ncbi:2-oxo-4-hydroxy-4-carboxy-5-ureidoimidazoline decarboxylase [Streptomyces sp. NPDC058741]|uniref:2-oxo-4-hydroxy-4-carboxy-5-ureidoimidazoline decarboxylase n=1 Tax=Streptomyces sp. NPDC058741 TaxID=3346620 RepID=UPI003687E751
MEPVNTASAQDLERLLLSCLRSPRWSRRVAAHRPYPDLASLLAAADEAAYDLRWTDLGEALAAESLPALPPDTYAAAHTALNAAHAAYEARFGHAFVICLDGLSPSEVLDRILEAIRSRLTNDQEQERAVTAEELRRLASGRLLDALRNAGTARSATDARPAAPRRSHVPPVSH